MQEWITAAEQEPAAKGYQLRAGQLRELTEAAEDGDTARIIAAAYNMGFKRGRNYERRQRHGVKKSKQDATPYQQTQRALQDAFERGQRQFRYMAARQSIGEEKAAAIADLEEYIARHPLANEHRYDMTSLQLAALIAIARTENSPDRALALAFNYGRAKGHRAG